MPIIRPFLAICAMLMSGLSVAQLPPASDIGPAAFLWPEERPWCPDADNTPPCGSSYGVGKRTEFPLTNGRLALVAQENTHAVQIGISYFDDPQTLDDFEIFYDPSEINLKPGHTCIRAPDAPHGIYIGDHATFFMRYVPNEVPEEAYYACSDVRFVAEADFKADGVDTHCFNVTYR
ncbi:unnamed protein product [Zymoseptoria tritici ST99CH_1A5]|uniref:Copper acquisition factor BIM1-like domain-containing protein n=3 Tax=Zymoseptoria tritici TaxID=1047171 RepID=F9WWA2_ZYMTI|nr:uncharacterized protein MYCGRDRAFT_89042 [Zymoseptoria tritici IPO323]EGP92544.1 hypothetical protein MYCGRDRAFT_89042 [Zymoseptoria tritici IPO323]SMR41783.1 unnamed protein product [Zymoseptoria tritici ST99CH_1E4]SMR43973.1 unnamed protein product [Zymoseptoria tritici ST99CH_3D1]SMY19130.1 unnamed protein product [Zymoseptoria tritici ST99CH_1A5]